MITMMGATGHTGKKITEALLKAGEKVRALGRGFFSETFRGADAVYTLLPTDRRSPDYRAGQDQQGEAIGESIDKPDLKYVQFSYADQAKALVQAGLSESFAGLYVAMTRAFNEGTVKPREGRTPANTTPTLFEDFVPELARAYQAA